MMLRTVRSLLLALFVLVTATVVDACISASGNTGSCCSPALASQTAACCQSSPAASASPCCSSYSSQSVQNSQNGWIAAQSSGGCSGAGCSASSSGGGCSGDGCGNGGGGGGDNQASRGCSGSGCSGSGSGNVGGGSSTGCADGSTGRGCSGSEDGSAYDASIEYQAANERQGPNQAPSDYAEYTDDGANNGGGTQQSGEVEAVHKAAISSVKNPSSEQDYEELPQEHVEEPQTPEAHTDAPEEHTDIPEEHTDIPETHTDIPKENFHEIEQPEGESTDAPSEEHTELPEYTEPPPALPTRPKKSHEGVRSRPSEKSNEFIRPDSTEKPLEIEEPEPVDIDESDNSLELGPGEDEAACQFLTCDYEENTLCLYESTPDEKPQLLRLLTRYGSRTRFSRAVRYLSRKWETVSGQYHNRVTGIPEAGTGETYAAVYLRPKERAILTTDNLYFTKTRMLFQAYEATKGMQMRMCCDDLENCPWSSNISVKASEKKWSDASGSCPKGTKKVLFVCENSGKYQGACGLDNVRVDGHTCDEIDPKELLFLANL